MKHVKQLPLPIDKAPVTTAWASVRVEELAKNERGSLTDGPFGSNLKSSHYTDSGPRVVRLQNISESRFIDEHAHISVEHFANLKRHEVIEGDVLVAMLGESLPRACIAPHHLGPAIVKADCARLRVDQGLTRPEYVGYALNADQVKKQAVKLVHGVGRPRLGLALLKDLEVPLAPLREQQAIVEALDRNYSKLDAAIAGLKRVQSNLKRYRASVLKAAVEGRLVPTEAELARQEGREYEPASVLLQRILVERRRRWEEAELAKMKAKGKTPRDDSWKEKYPEPAALNTRGLPPLPEGWVWTSLDSLLREPLRNGHSAPESKSGEGLPTLSLTAVTIGDFENNIKLTTASQSKVTDLWIEPGDIFVQRSNTPELVGTARLYHGQPRIAIFPDLLIRVRLIPFVSAGYVESVLHSPGGRSYFRKTAKGIAGSMPKVDQETIAQTPIPIPPFSEQVRISMALGEHLSAGETVASSVARDVARCTRLRQSILKWAFEGKLVDQDPNDEPASALLARIRAERESTPTAPRTRARSPSPRAKKATKKS